MKRMYESSDEEEQELPEKKESPGKYSKKKWEDDESDSEDEQNKEEIKTASTPNGKGNNEDAEAHLESFNASEEEEVAGFFGLIGGTFQVRDVFLEDLEDSSNAEGQECSGSDIEPLEDGRSPLNYIEEEINNVSVQSEEPQKEGIVKEEVGGSGRKGDEAEGSSSIPGQGENKQVPSTSTSLEVQCTNDQSEFEVRVRWCTKCKKKQVFRKIKKKSKPNQKTHRRDNSSSGEEIGDKVRFFTHIGDPSSQNLTHVTIRLDPDSDDEMENYQPMVEIINYTLKNQEATTTTNNSNTNSNETNSPVRRLVDTIVRNVQPENNEAGPSSETKPQTKSQQPEQSGQENSESIPVDLTTSSDDDEEVVGWFNQVHVTFQLFDLDESDIDLIDEE